MHLCFVVAIDVGIRACHAVDGSAVQCINSPGPCGARVALAVLRSDGECIGLCTIFVMSIKAARCQRVLCSVSEATVDLSSLFFHKVVFHKVCVTAL